MDVAGVNMVNIDPPLKSTVQTRFSILRYMKVVKQFNPIQRGFISKHNLGNLLTLPGHLMIPLYLLQWLVFHTSSTESYGGGMFFKKKDKIINFNKEIVDKVFGFPLGTMPFVLDSNDPEVVREVEDLRRKYLKGKNIPVQNLESILLGANNEEVFMRSFILFFITTILCPSTYNFVNPKYLYCLRDRDIPHIRNLYFATLFLDHLWDEMEAWKNKIFMNPGELNRMAWIGGCIQLLGIVYLDFVDFNGNAGPIDYNLPRMSVIKNADFAHLVSLDLNVEKRKYGLRDTSLIPYGAHLAILAPVAQLGELGDVNEPADNANVPELVEHNIPNIEVEVVDLAPHLAQPYEAPANADIDIEDNVVFADANVEDVVQDNMDINPDDLHAFPDSMNDSFDSILHASPDSIDDIPIYVGVIQEFIQVAENPSIHSNDHQDNIAPEGEDIKHLGDGLSNIASCYAELSASPSIGLAEGFVSADSPQGNASSTQGTSTFGLKSAFYDVGLVEPTVQSFNDTDVVLNLAMGYADYPISPYKLEFLQLFPLHLLIFHLKVLCLDFRFPLDTLTPCTEQSIPVGTLTSPRTREKRNRKKRATKVSSHDQSTSKNLKVDPDVDAFYTKYLRNKYFKTRKPTIIGLLSS